MILSYLELVEMAFSKLKVNWTLRVAGWCRDDLAPLMEPLRSAYFHLLKRIRVVMQSYLNKKKKVRLGQHNTQEVFLDSFAGLTNHPVIYVESKVLVVVSMQRQPSFSSLGV